MPRPRSDHDSPARPLIVAALVAGALAMVAGRVESSPMTLNTTWMSGGVEHTVTTNQLPDESYDDFVARHDAAVAERQKKYPPG